MRFLRGALIAGLLPVLSSAAQISLTALGSQGSSDGALFIQYTAQPTGSGNLNSFLRIQNNQTQSGYNTDGTLEFDTKSGNFTRSLLLTAVPVVNIGNVAYREFVLDINQNTASITLDDLEIYQTSDPNLTGYSFGANATQVFALATNTFVLGDLGSGSGQGDFRVLIPDSVFTAAPYVVLYSAFSGSGGGFEEWAVSENAGGASGVPEPATLAVTGVALLGLGAWRRRTAVK